MMFTNDEALALSLGLAAARGLGLAGAMQAIAGAQAKLERVIPANMKRRMRSRGESVSLAHFAPEFGSDSAPPVLSSAAHARQGVRMQIGP